jgi:hypothetical protein
MAISQAYTFCLPSKKVGSDKEYKDRNKNTQEHLG